MNDAPHGLDPDEREELLRAKRLLEHPSLAARMTDLLGRPIERSIRLLPDKVTATLHEITRRSLDRALRIALKTLDERPTDASSDRAHRWVSAASGAAGGMFGLAGLALELPFTTVVMMRSIGDIARSEGHDLGAAEIRLACLEVFALGGPSRADDGAETGYYALRAGMSMMLADAARHVATHGMRKSGAPVLVRLLDRIAVRFGLVVEEKVALELLPVVGAVSGALINSVFMEHFQSTARGHFILKRLEARHGLDAVRRAYEAAAE